MNRDVLTEVAAARPAHLSPDAPIDPATKQAELAHAFARETVRRRRRLRPSRPRLGFSAAVVTAGLAAAVAVIAMPGDDGQPPLDGTWSAQWAIVDGGQRPSARSVLFTASENAAKKTEGKYWRIRTINDDLTSVGKPGNTYLFIARWSLEEWKERNFRGSDTSVQQELGARPASPADAAAWKRDGAPKELTPAAPHCRNETCDPVRTGPGKPDHADLPGLISWDIGDSEVPVEQLRDLPDNPVALKTRVLQLARTKPEPAEGDKPMTESQILLGAGSAIIADLPVSSRTRAAAFRMMATVPEVKVTGKARDRLGRTGTQLRLPTDDGYYRDELLIDEKTGTMLATRTIQLRPNPEVPVSKPGMVSNETLYVAAGWTDTKPSS